MYYLGQLEKLLTEPSAEPAESGTLQCRMARHGFSLPAEPVVLAVDSLVRPGFWLEYPHGNASFASPGDRLFVPPVMVGDAADIATGTETVFIDVREGLRCTGLAKFVGGRTASGIPVLVCDNHNFVLEAWQLLQASPPVLVHIDQHRDEAECRCGPGGEIRQTRVCDYIDYARRKGWIQPAFLSFIQRSDLGQAAAIPAADKICNIDLDIFHPECTVLTLEEKAMLIRRAAAGASLITIATSPGYIDQERSCVIARLLWRCL